MFLIQINTNQMRVYPYTQLISVNEEQILIQMKQRRLCIEGTRLSLSAMDEEEIWIKGEFRKVELSDE